MLSYATQGRQMAKFSLLALCAAAALQGCAKQAAPAGSGLGTSTPAPAGTPTELYVRGAKAYDAKNYAAATADLQAVVDADPKFLMARERLGDIYKDQSNYPKAIEQYTTVVQADPADAGTWYKLGVAQQFAGKFPDAVASYEKSLKADPQFWKAKSNIGMVRLLQRKNDEAVTLTGAAKDMAVDQPEAWAHYGDALDASGKLAEAEAAYKKSLELMPGQPAVLANLGSNLVAQKKSADAIPYLEQAAKADPSADAERKLGDALLADKKLPEAEAHYQAALKLDAGHYRALNGIAEIKLAQGNKAEAVATWAKSIAIKADQPAVLAALKANQ